MRGSEAVTDDRKSPGVPVSIPGVLVDPSWLGERLGGQGLRVVDLRDVAAYASGHITGAVHVDLRELGSTVGTLENVLLPPEEFGALCAFVYGARSGYITGQNLLIDGGAYPGTL